MNDARMSPELVANERLRDRAAFRAAAQSGAPLGRPRGVLSAELAAARQEAARGVPSAPGLTQTETTVRVPSERTDPGQTMRCVRLSLAAVLILVLCLIWIRQRRWR